MSEYRGRDGSRKKCSLESHGSGLSVTAATSSSSQSLRDFANPPPPAWPQNVWARSTSPRNRYSNDRISRLENNGFRLNTAAVGELSMGGDGIEPPTSCL